MKQLHVGALICLTLCAGAWGADIPVSTEPRRYTELDESFYNASFLSWAGNNSSDRLNLADPEAANARAARLAELGVTGVLYNGRHFRLSYPEEYDLIERYGRIVTEACHRHGIKVVEHHEFTVFSYASYPAMLAHLDWLQKDVRTGEPWRWACIHNPGFLAAYGDYLASYARHTNADGYMLDEVGYAGPSTCGCPHCRATYTEALGQPFPVWTEGQGSFDDPLYRNVVRWRSKLTPRAQQTVMNRIRQIRPDTMNMKYCSDYADPGTAARGWDLTAHAALYSPFMGWENMIAEASNGWRPFLRALKLRLSYGNYYDIPVWSLNREMTTRDAVYLGWALCQAGKHSIWYGARALSTEEDLDAFAKYNAWPHVMPHQRARCLTDTGVLLSNQTRFTDPGHRLFWNEFRGWLDMLILDNHQFDTLLDGGLERAGRLGKYKVLVLVSQASLTDEQVRHLTEWVRAGGTAIVTGVTASRDGLGNVREHNALADAMGISLLKPECLNGRVRVQGGLDGLALDFEAGHGYFPADVTAPDRVRVWATLTTPQGAAFPAVAESSLGEGRFLFVGIDLGTANYEDKARNNWPLRGVWDSNQRALIAQLVEYAHREPAPARIQAPDKVVGVVYQEHGGEHDGRVHVHLLNMMCATAEPGYRFQYGRPEVIEYPPVTEDITIRLSTPITGAVVARTPEKEREVALNATRDGGGAVITVPPGVLGGYLHITADAKPAPGQAPLTPPIEAPEEEETTERAKKPATAAKCPWPLARDSAVTPEGPPAFAIAPSGALNVRVGNHVVLTGDGLDFTPREYTIPPGPTQVDTAATATTVMPKEADGWTGVIAGGATDDGIVWSRETAAYDNRLEVTFAAMVPPGGRGPDAHIGRYQLRIPCALLKGARYTARYGRHMTNRAPKRGTFTGEEPEEPEVPFLGHVRCMEVAGGPLDFFLDISTCGPWGLYVEDFSSSYKAHFFRQGDEYIMLMCTPDARWGTKLSNKVVFRLGKHDMNEIHPIAVTHYTWPMPVMRRIQFTPDAPCTGMMHREKLAGYDREFEAWLDGAFADGAGWIGAVQGAVVAPSAHPELGPLFGGGWRGSGDSTFRIAHLNGRVLCNVLLSGAGGESACMVRVNGEPPRHVRVAAGERETVTIPACVREGRLDVTLSGEAWTLSGIVPQLLMAEEEDYLFNRTWWAFGDAPWTWPGFDGKKAWKDYPPKY